MIPFKMKLLVFTEEKHFKGSINSKNNCNKVASAITASETLTRVKNVKYGQTPPSSKILHFYEAIIIFLVR